MDRERGNGDDAELLEELPALLVELGCVGALEVRKPDERLQGHRGLVIRAPGPARREARVERDPSRCEVSASSERVATHALEQRDERTVQGFLDAGEDRVRQRDRRLRLVGQEEALGLPGIHLQGVTEGAHVPEFLACPRERSEGFLEPAGA